MATQMVNDRSQTDARRDRWGARYALLNRIARRHPAPAHYRSRKVRSYLSPAEAAALDAATDAEIRACWTAVASRAGCAVVAGLTPRQVDALLATPGIDEAIEEGLRR